MLGDPLVTAIGDDNNGFDVTHSDLLGRITIYADWLGDETDYTYDSLGNLTSKYNYDIGNEQYQYDSYNRLTDVLFNSTTYATVTYDTYGRIQEVDYPAAGSMKVVQGFDTLGRLDNKTFTLGNGTTTVSDADTLSQSSQVSSDVVTSGSSSLTSSYTYDGADRLTAATVGSDSYSYGFGSQASYCGTGTDKNNNSGKNGNRTSETVNSSTTYFCYDNADRINDSSDPTYQFSDWDAHNNMTYLGLGTSRIWLSYDSSGRDLTLDTHTSAGDGSFAYYNYDALDRMLYREVDTLSHYSHTNQHFSYYAYTGTDDTPAYTRDGNWNITEENIQLPGSVLLTVKPQETITNNKAVYSLPNLHGDTMLTTDASGANTSTGSGPLSSYIYDPFGSMSGSSSAPSNVSDGSLGYVGTYSKLTESQFSLTPMQMGDRIYLPTLGRFTQVDPVDGGTPSAYVYPPDPINNMDLTGDFSTPGWVLTPARFVGRNADTIGLGIGIGAAGACVVVTAGTCALVLTGAAVAGGAVAGGGEYMQTHDVSSTVVVGGLNTAIGLAGVKGGSGAVRYFGTGRNYTSVTKALTKQPAQQRAKDLGKDVVKSQVTGNIIQRAWNKIKSWF